MKRSVLPAIISANMLASGQVVYRTMQDGWSSDIAQAEVLTADAAARAALRNSAGDPEVVGAYLVPVRLSADGPAPTALRDRSRLSGLGSKPNQPVDFAICV